MELGIGSYTYPWAISEAGFGKKPVYNAESLLHKAITYGLRRLQLADNLPLHKLDKASHEILRTKAAANKIQIEPGTKGLRADHLLEYLNLAVYYSSPFLRVIIDDDNYQPSVSEVISVINTVLPEFRSAGVLIAIENHDRFPAKVLEQIILSSDIGHVGICLDTVNSLGCGEGIKEVCAVLAPYTVNLHIKDFTIKRVATKMGFIVEGTPAGEGQLHLPVILNELARYGRCESAILEVWSSAENSIEQTIEKEEVWAEKSVSYLKEIIKYSI